MAYAALVSLKQTIEKIAMNPDQYSSALRHFNQIRCIDELFLLLEFADYSHREGRIRDVANEVHEVLELLISKQSRSRLGSNKYNRFLAKFRRRARFQHQLEKIRELIDAIAREMIELEKESEDQLQLSDSPAAIEDELQLSDSVAANLSTASSVMEIEMNSLEIEDESQLGDSPAADSASLMAVASRIGDVVGLEDDWLAIKTRLCGESPKLQVIPIVGMGDGSKSLEDEAEECLEDIVSRSLVLVTKKRYNGRIKGCSLHDLVRDMCIRKANENSFFLRHHPTSTTCIFRIPAEVSMPQNLQTLIIDAEKLQTLIIDVKYRWKLIGRPNISTLPQEIWMMPQLRHITCYGRFPCPKEPTCALKNLQTLSLVLHDVCVVEILEKIPNIKKLGIDCSYYDHGTHLNNLEFLHHLRSLELRYADWRRDSICFPKMLRKLILCNMSLPWSEMSVVGSLPNLEVLKLREFACIGSTWETSEGEFLQLQYLLISTSKLQHWITEEFHFPRLKFLLLRQCWHLNEIPEGIGEIATLELIDVICSNLRESLVESAKRIQEEQQSLGNDALRVFYIPKIM
ncbi:putative late blight resistance protein R1B-14 [Salvia divinorum]|uniref:Late blight resistance protein R1B-14 n=1 Tax=Salvia divinorum TaxID=28513 RepID=A0ABD1HA69_SALDI